MASTRSGSICQSKPLNISQKLLDGEKFLKWTDQVDISHSQSTSAVIFDNWFNWLFPKPSELFLCNRITPVCQSLYNWTKTDSFSTTSTRKMKCRSSTFSKLKMSGPVRRRGRRKIRRFGALLIWARDNWRIKQSLLSTGWTSATSISATSGGF